MNVAMILAGGTGQRLGTKLIESVNCNELEAEFKSHLRMTYD